MGVLKAKVGGNWVPVMQDASVSALTPAQADARYVNVTGDDLQGPLKYNRGVSALKIGNRTEYALGDLYFDVLNLRQTGYVVWNVGGAIVAAVEIEAVGGWNQQISMGRIVHRSEFYFDGVGGLSVFAQDYPVAFGGVADHHLIGSPELWQDPADGNKSKMRWPVYKTNPTTQELLEINARLYTAPGVDNFVYDPRNWSLRSPVTVPNSQIPIRYDSDWKIATLLNGWEQYHPADVPPRYRKLTTGQVEVQATVKNGPDNSVIMELPLGYRPGYTISFVGTCMQSGVSLPMGCEIDVRTDGGINVALPSGGSNGWVTIGMTFSL